MSIERISSVISAVLRQPIHVQATNINAATDFPRNVDERMN